MSFGFVLAAPVAAHLAVQQAAVSTSTLTPERLAASLAALLGLIGVIVGGLAMARAAGRIRTGPGQRGAIVALVAGLIAMAVGGLVVATADGGLGTGNGLAGGVVAIVLGLIGVVLGGLTLSHSRRTAKTG